MGFVHFRLDGRAVGLGLLLAPGEGVQLKHGDDVGLTVEVEVDAEGEPTGTLGIVVKTTREIGSDAYGALEARQRVIATPEIVHLESSRGKDHGLVTLSGRSVLRGCA